MINYRHGATNWPVVIAPDSGNNKFYDIEFCKKYLIVDNKKYNVPDFEYDSSIPFESDIIQYIQENENQQIAIKSFSVQDKLLRHYHAAYNKDSKLYGFVCLETRKFQGHKKLELLNV